MGCTCGRHATVVTEGARIPDSHSPTSDPVPDSLAASSLRDLISPTLRPMPRSNTITNKKNLSLPLHRGEEQPEGNSPRPQLPQARFGTMRKEATKPSAAEERLTLVRATLHSLYERVLTKSHSPT